MPFSSFGLFVNYGRKNVKYWPLLHFQSPLQTLDLEVSKIINYNKKCFIGLAEGHQQNEKTFSNEIKLLPALEFSKLLTKFLRSKLRRNSRFPAEICRLMSVLRYLAG
jgi:hypothetical protein